MICRCCWKGPGGAPAAPGGAPIQLSLDLIDEDPDQPRTEFDPDALRELAETIAQRGVRQPISVRPHPHKHGRWMLNFGARRLRGSRLAGKATVPAFVDATADSFDQVIENEQRQSLTPLELALFVQRRLREGQSLADIGRRLGKSRTYMSFVAALIDPPDWLLQAYRRGACRGLSELYELRKLHEKAPDQVNALLESQSVVSRADLQALKQAVAPQAPMAPAAASSGSSPGVSVPAVLPSGAGAQTSPRGAKPPTGAAGGEPVRAPASLPQAFLEVVWKGCPLRIGLGPLRAIEGEPCLLFIDGEGHENWLPLVDLQRTPGLQLVEG